MRGRRRSKGLLLLVVLLICGCGRSRTEETLSVGEVRLRLEPPSGWDHVDNGGRHEFRNGDQHLVLAELGIAAEDTLAAVIQAARAALSTEQGRYEVTAMRWKDDPILAARSAEERQDFWRYWTAAALDPSRRSGSEGTWAVDTLIERAHGLSPLGTQELVRWFVAQQIDTLRYQIDRVTPIQTKAGEWWVARTWLRASHEFEHRYAGLVSGGRLVILESGPILGPQTSDAFDSLISSTAPGD